MTLINSGGYPLRFSLKLAERLMRLGEYDAAGNWIKAIGSSGDQHPLVDELHSSWLWCIGKRTAAISFAARSANRWKKSYLFSHLGALYSLIGKSHKSEQCFHIARRLAKREHAKARGQRSA